MQQIAADVNGNGIADRIQTHRGQPKPTAPVGESTLQIAFHDGRYSEPITVETPDLLNAVDLDGDGKVEVFVANEGNTARGGGVIQVQGCVLRRVLTASGQPFLYVYFGGGLGCAPACYPVMACQHGNAGIEVVVSDAHWTNFDPSQPVKQTLTDDLVYEWSLERFRLQSGVMVSVSAQRGTARHGDLPVPKRQGFSCSVA